MASIKRAHQWQAFRNHGVHLQRCARCGAERLNASPVCYEEIPDPETPDDKAE